MYVTAENWIGFKVFNNTLKQVLHKKKYNYLEKFMWTAMCVKQWLISKRSQRIIELKK